MSNTVIKVQNLSKKYNIGQVHGNLLSERIGNDIRSLFNRLRGRNVTPLADDHSPEKTFWALRDVHFEVKQGEVVGIIGRNGAGKSTLLKILSKITSPTVGRVEMVGRAASLLEVGTGFHPELTGKENIFLNGAILGMSKAEIRKKFDEIVSFAEVEKFIDTPVKRYSSGMYVRLAFAVAAHLEPEILIVDEVLAVGDAQFQKKCLGKMGEVAKEGRTVLFVSHNMGAIESFCNKVLLLDGGRIENQGYDVPSIIGKYLNPIEKINTTEWINSGNHNLSNLWFSPSRFTLCDKSGGKLPNIVPNDTEIWISIEGDIQELDYSLKIGYALYSEDGALLYKSFHTDTEQSKWPVLKKGHCCLTTKISPMFLNASVYRFELIGGLHCRQWLFEPGKMEISLSISIQGKLSDSPYWVTKRPGLIAPLLDWYLRTHVSEKAI
jgi:lipopolysaccharide transport system ATP-binding protein